MWIRHHEESFPDKSDLYWTFSKNKKNGSKKIGIHFFCSKKHKWKGDREILFFREIMNSCEKQPDPPASYI